MMSVASVKKQELNSALVALVIHALFFALLLLAMKMNVQETAKPHFIKLRLGSSEIASDKLALEEVAEQEIEQLEAQEIILPEVGAEEQKPQLIKIKKPHQKRVAKVSVSSAAKGSENGNSSAGRTSLTYIEKLQYGVQEASEIPSQARAQGITGNAVLRLTFTRSGAVEEYQLVKKTGHPVLDNAALQVGENLLQNSFPAMPQNFERGRKRVTYDFPISYE